MPGGDRTGPEGLGPMTGRAAGSCAGSSAPGYMSAAGGRGLAGRGRGGGRGWRNRFFATGLPGWMRAGFGHQPTPVDEKQELAGLKRQAQLLQNSLKEIDERMEQLGKEDKK